MIMNKKGITPIISVILLLMMSVAVAGIAWFWLQSMTQKVMSQTEQGTDTSLKTMAAPLQVYGSSCSISAQTVSVALYNPGSSSATVTGMVIGGLVNSTVTGTVAGNGGLAQVTAHFASAPASGVVTVSTDVAGSTAASVTCE